MTNHIPTPQSDINQPIKSGRGATNVGNGLKFEQQITNLLHIQTITNNTPTHSKKLIADICSTLEIDFQSVKNSIAYRNKGGQKADITLYFILDDHTTKEILISIKGIISDTQFANFNTTKLTTLFNHSEAAIAIQKFMGANQYRAEWQQEYGHEIRHRYLLNELNLQNKKDIIEASQQIEMRTTLFDSILGNEENKIHLIIAPARRWDMNPNNLLIVNCEKTRTHLDNIYNTLPFNFLCQQTQFENNKIKVVSPIDKNGKLATPNGEGSIRFADGLISIKRKGSEGSVKNGFDPSDTQVICSVKKLYQLLNT